MTTLTKGLRNSVTELIAMCDQQIANWETTRTQLKMLASINGNGHAQIAQVEAMAEAALQTHRTKKVGRPPNRKAQGRPLPQVEKPDNLPDLAGMNARGAVLATLKVMKKAVSVKETTAYMISGGWTPTKEQPAARLVGIQLAMLAKSKEVKKSPTGFFSLRG